jgi:putative hydrolase of the HAD superfamily
MERRPNWIVWDLGGVVIELNFDGALLEVQRSAGVDIESLRSALREEFCTPPSGYSVTEKAVSGRITGNEYIRAICDALGQSVSAQQIKAILQEILVGEKQEQIDLITELSALGLRQACMSNVDEVHWEKIAGMPNITKIFERKFLSFKEMLVKPEKAAFVRMCEILECNPEGLIFIDDRIRNVKAAQQFGITSILFSDHELLRSDLKTLGLAIL